MSKVVLKDFIVVPDEDLEAILEELDKHIALTRAEPGCLRFDVSRRSASSNRFNVYEEFDNQESFERHQQRARASQWGQLTTNVERHYTVDTAE